MKTVRQHMASVLAAGTLWLWRLLALVILLLAIVVSIGREIAPLLKDNKPWLEERLTRLSGYPVRMESAEGQWEGLVPQIQTTRLTMGDAVMLERALLRVDLLRSLLYRTLVFDALSVQGATLVIPVSDDDANQKMNLQAGLDFLFGSANIRLRDVAVYLRRETGQPLLIRIQSLDVGNASDDHWIQGMFTLADAKTPIELMGAFTGSASDILAGQGRAYVDVGDGSKLREVLAFARNKADLPVAVDHPGGVQGRVWLTWKDNRLQWQAAASLHNLKIIPLGYRLSYAGNLAGSFSVEGGLLASLSDVSRYEFTASMPRGEILINEKSYRVPDWGLHYRSADQALGGEPSLSLFLPEFDLGEIKAYRELSDNVELRTVLRTLQPQGLLRHVALTWPLQKHSVFRPALRANLAQVSVAAWEGAPALTRVDGYVEATPDGGFVEVDSRQGFSMHFPQLYSKAMVYQQVRGRVQWEIRPDNHHIYVASPAIETKGEDGEGRAAFWVDIPPARSSLASQLYLTVGIKQSAVQYRHKYLPNTLPLELRRWLNASIKRGAVTENGFIYRGSLRANEEAETSILYYARLRDAELRFDPAWPALTDADATVLVDNGDTYADISQATIGGIQLSRTAVNVKSGHFLTLRGDFKGSGERGLRFLRDTPLRKTLGSTFDHWHLAGNISGNISLGLAITDVKAGEVKEQEFQEVAIQFKDNDLLLQDLDVPLKSLNGDIFYSSSLGLSATELSATLWGHPQVFSITPVPDQDGLPDIMMTANGLVAVPHLAQWTRQPAVYFLQGDIPIQGKLEIPLDNAKDPATPFATVSFFSDMRGVQLDLPKPLHKTAHSPEPMALTIDLFDDRQRYRLLYGSLASALVDVPHQHPPRGVIWINQAAPADIGVLPDGLEIRGQLSYAVLQDWLQVIDRYGKFNKKIIVPTPGPGEDPLPSFHFSLDDFRVGEQSFGAADLSAIYQRDHTTRQHYWQVAFDHRAAQGHYRYYDDVTRLPELTLEWLNLDRWEVSDSGATAAEKNVGASPEIKGQEEAVADPLANVVPQDLPALHFHVKQLIHQGVKLGEWRFTVHPQPWGASLENFSATMPGVNIGAVSGDQGATLLWRRKGEVMDTEISARINQTSNKEAVKSLFGIDRIIEAEKSELAGTLAWAGSPAYMQFANLTGDIRIHTKNGRFLNSNTRTDLMRVINVFNFNAWARRLKLDFSDLYKKGVSFDRVDGHLQLDHGKVIIDEPLVMVSPSSRFTLQGVIDSQNNTINADLMVTLPVSDNAAWITALAGGLPAAAGVWVVSKIFEKQIDTLSSVSYTVTGTLDDPDIAFKSMKKGVLKNDQTKPVVAPGNAADTAVENPTQ